MSKNVVVALAVTLSAGAMTPLVGPPAPTALRAQMPAPTVCELAPSSCCQILRVAASEDDWTAWGGAMRDSPALNHK